MTIKSENLLFCTSLYSNLCFPCCPLRILAYYEYFWLSGNNSSKQEMQVSQIEGRLVIGTRSFQLRYICDVVSINFRRNEKPMQMPFYGLPVFHFCTFFRVMQCVSETRIICMYSPCLIKVARNILSGQATHPKRFQNLGWCRIGRTVASSLMLLLGQPKATNKCSHLATCAPGNNMVNNAGQLGYEQFFQCISDTDCIELVEDTFLDCLLDLSPMSSTSIQIV